MPTYLTEIVAAHRKAAAADDRDVRRAAVGRGRLPPARGFAAALATAATGGVAVIAEVKRRSPSKGPLAPDLDPADVAAAYAAGGATCLSVLTDRDYFGGSPADLLAARSAAGLPVLRKDFTVTVADVYDARLMGADAVLLIVAALSDRELADFAAAAAEVGLDALVEVHDEPELDRALAAGATLVGVNQRDLATFSVDGERAERLAAAIPDDVVAVAESGIGGPEDAARLARRRLPGGARRRDARPGGRPGGRGRRAGRASGGPTGRRRAMRFVKICGITSEADALLAVGLGADALGFIFAPSPRQVSPAVVGDIVKRLPHGVLTVGVFRDDAPRRVVEIANQIGLGAVQLHGHETAEDTRWVRERVSCTIKAFPAGDRTIDRFDEFGADYLLIDGPSPGSGEVFDWRLGEGVVDPNRLIVSGGLRPDNVADAISHLHPFGVDVATGVEAAPGRKDPQKLREFVANARRAAAEVAAEHPPDPDDAAGARWRPAAGRAVRRWRQEVAPGDAPYDWMDG